MKDDSVHQGDRGEPLESRPRAVSRRDFLKIAGVAGATVGMGGVLGPVLAGCGEEETTTTAAPTTTAGPTTTGAAATTTSSAPASTETTAGAEQGRPVKVGVVAPFTGIFAAFASSLNWAMDRWKEALVDGVTAGDGKVHPIEILPRDTQSDGARAGQVTGDLITNDSVDVVFSSGSPANVNPSATQCEALGCPSISTFVPWQAFYFGRGATPDAPFKWTYTFAVGLEALVGTYLDMWSQVETNKKVACLWPNDDDGHAWSDAATGAPPMFEAAGYTLTVPGLYPPGSEDYTAQISEFKKQGCEVFAGAVPAPDFTTFWNQSAQQGFNPKICTVGLALLFPEAATAVGENVVGCSSELVWDRSYPYTSSLTGETCQELADDYETRTGSQWSPAVGQYMAMEWFVAALKNTANVDDREAVIEAVGSTKTDTMWGPVDLTLPIDLMGGSHPVKNVYRGVVQGGQWIKGTGKWPYEIIPVSNAFAAGTTVQGTLQPL